MASIPLYIYIRHADPELTEKRHRLRAARKFFLSNFDAGLKKLFADFSEAKNTGNADRKADAQRAIEISVLVGIDTYLKELSISENTKEDVERISIRLLGMVTCYGWEAYDQVVIAINQEYNWRQANGGNRWVMPESVTLRLAEVTARKQAFDQKRALPVSVHLNGRQHKLSRQEQEKRRNERRAALLAAQPKKGAGGGGKHNYNSNGVSNRGKGSKGAKKNRGAR